MTGFQSTNHYKNNKEESTPDHFKKTEFNPKPQQIIRSDI